MDYERQWALFSYWLEHDEVTYIFMDRRLQRGFYHWMVDEGIDPDVIAHTLQAGPNPDHPVIRHARGHQDHFHVRFRCHEETDVRCRD